MGIFRTVHSLKRRAGLLLLGAMLPLGMLGAASPVSAASAYGTCTDVPLPVALATGQSANQTISGELCTPNTWAAGAHQVDVATSGATYNKSYFDWQNPSTYSYADKTLQAHRAIFVYDRIGTGASSHPPSASISIQSDAYVLHQIIQWLRMSQGYTQVNAIGHSYGSVITVDEAGTYKDENRVVLTGLLHAPDPGLAALADFLFPALLDPRTGVALDPGYLTTIPHSRSVFYSPATTDPTVMAYDNAHPDTVSATSLSTSALVNYGVPGVNNPADHIMAPVLLVNGEDDNFFCGSLEILNCADGSAVEAYEAPYFTSAASLTAKSVPHTGHDLALSTSADQSFAMINDWIVQQ